MKRIKLIKVKERKDAEVPNNIQEGEYRIGIAPSKPIVGTSFWLTEVFEKNGEKYPDAVGVLHWFRTSTVVDIIDENTFVTLNSIYRIENV
jgi:ABC-type phosphate transport system substrate-binding protein